MDLSQVINQLANENGMSKTEILDEMQNAIDAAWESPNGADFREKLFPEGKPSPELFIRRMTVMAIMN